MVEPTRSLVFPELDLDLERRALLTSVIPELQEHCRMRSYRLTELDVGLPRKPLEHDAHCHKNACLQAVRGLLGFRPLVDPWWFLGASSCVAESVHSAEANENCSLVALILMEDRVGEFLLPEILDAGQYQQCKDAGIKMHDLYVQHDQDYLLKVKVRSTKWRGKIPICRFIPWLSCNLGLLQDEEAEGYRNAVETLKSKLPEGDRSRLLKSRFEEVSEIAPFRGAGRIRPDMRSPFFLCSWSSASPSCWMPACPRDASG